MVTPIYRITLFKIPDKENGKKLLEMYTRMPEMSVKDGKRYILSVTPGKAFPDQRAQGYTIAVVSKFASVEDMKYYDDDCAAHKTLKSFAKTVHQGAMVVYYESILD